MARWVLNCPFCKIEFTHSTIGPTVKDYYFPLKPIFPIKGLSVECPKCRKTSIFQRHELLYRQDEQ
jgi:hypothetical protein